MAALIPDTAPPEMLDEPMDMVASTQAIMGSLDANDYDDEEADLAKDDKNRPRADSDLVEADHVLGAVKSGAGDPTDVDVEAKFVDEDGNLEASVQELESAVGTEVTTDYGKALVEKVEEIDGEMFLIVKYEDGAEENIKYDDLDKYKASPKKSSSKTKTASTKKQVAEKKASPAKTASPTKKTSPAKTASPTKKIAKSAAKSKPAATTKKTVTAKAAKPAKKTAPAKVKASTAKKITKKPAKVAAKITKKKTGKR